jgi:hypothetical protein
VFRFETAVFDWVLPPEAMRIAVDLREVRVRIDGEWFWSTRKLYTLQRVTGGEVIDVRNRVLNADALRDGEGPILWERQP